MPLGSDATGLNAAEPDGPGGAARARNPTSHISTTSTISLTIRLPRASWNAMNPRIQCVLTQ